MEPHIPIENLLLINDATGEARQSVLDAFTEALKGIDSVENVQTGQSENGLWVRFYCDWEPPFKQLKQISKAQPEVTCTLLSDALVKSHWLSKARYVAGKGDELTVSRVDDDFPEVFRAIFDTEYATWEADRTPPFPRYGSLGSLGSLGS